MKRIQQQAISHYNRMIKWAEKQPQSLAPHMIDMKTAIKETYGWQHCAYCTHYNFPYCNNGDGKCPLENYNTELHFCCKGLYSKMSNSKTWHTWIKYAKQVREYIRENG